MKLIINTSNIIIGGGIQVSLSILNELLKYSSNEYHVFISPKVASQINSKNFPSNFHFYNFKLSPASIFTRKKVISELDRLESEICPDAVFTVFGPSYWKPKNLHFSGFADGWCYTPNSIAFKKLTFIEFIKVKLLIFYKNYHIKNSSDFIFVETQIAKNNIIKNLKIKKDIIFVVGNTYNKFFDKFFIQKPVKKNNQTFKLLTLSSYFVHKNLEIIIDVLKVLNKKSKKSFIFYLTIDEKVFKSIFGDTKEIINLGPQTSADCPRLYQNVDALFLPTLLETFSASYPEAMKMKKPILTSNLDFAKDICDNAAMYFCPTSAEDIADKIIKLSNDKKLYNELVKRGAKRLKKFETAETRVSKYLSILNTKISNKEKISKK